MENFKFEKSIDMIVMLIIGGLGSISGSVIGAIFLAASLELIDHRAARRPTDTDHLGELGLVGAAEVVDEREQRRLVEVEVEFGEAQIERAAQAAGRVDQRDLDTTPRRGGLHSFDGGHQKGMVPYIPAQDNSAPDSRARDSTAACDKSGGRDT